MTELLKDFIGAWGSRTKSHIFGSFVLAFLAVNWKVVYFLLFSDVRAAIRISYFEANSDWLSLYLLPLIAGSLIALGLPFLNDKVHRLVSVPINSMRMRDDEHASKRLAQKNEQELLRNETLKIREGKLIAQAITDQEIDDVISDPEKRNELQQQIDELRVQSNQPPSIEAKVSNSPLENLSAVEIEVVRTLAKSSYAMTQNGILEDEDFGKRVAAIAPNFSAMRQGVDTNAALKSLAAKKLVTSKQVVARDNKVMRKGMYYSLTAEGYSLYDIIPETSENLGAPPSSPIHNQS